jgi:catalase
VPLEDFQLREKIFYFDHERILKRVVHARGFGVDGYFESNGELEREKVSGIKSAWATRFATLAATGFKTAFE